MKEHITPYIQALARCNTPASRLVQIEAVLSDFADYVEPLERKDKEEDQQLRNLQHSRTVEADAYWREQTGNKHVLPDLGVLVTFLLERCRAADIEAGHGMP